MITLDDVKKMEIELEYLRYFYDAVDDPLGCASDDVYDIIKQQYVDSGNTLPEGY